MSSDQKVLSLVQSLSQATGLNSSKKILADIIKDNSEELIDLCDKITFRLTVILLFYFFISNFFGVIEIYLTNNSFSNSLVKCQI